MEYFLRNVNFHVLFWNQVKIGTNGFNFKTKMTIYF